MSHVIPHCLEISSGQLRVLLNHTFTVSTGYSRICFAVETAAPATRPDTALSEAVSAFPSPATTSGLAAPVVISAVAAVGIGGRWSWSRLRCRRSRSSCRKVLLVEGAVVADQDVVVPADAQVCSLTAHGACAFRACARVFFVFAVVSH